MKTLTRNNLLLLAQILAVCLGGNWLAPATAHGQPSPTSTEEPASESAPSTVEPKPLGEGTVLPWNIPVDDAPKPPKKRRCAWSDDGGETWRDWQIVETLPDGPQGATYGCFGGLVRLPVKDRDILLYSNCDSDGDVQHGRRRGTVWASFDGGKTWPIKRLVFEGGFGYSALDAGRFGTRSEGQIYLFFANWPDGGGTMVRFNLSWVLGGEETGDGQVPEWIQAGSR